MQYIANSDYEDRDTEPLILKVGDEVDVGEADRTWPGWVWAKNATGCDGYVPVEFLQKLAGTRHKVIEDFDPCVLTPQAWRRSGIVTTDSWLALV